MIKCVCRGMEFGWDIKNFSVTYLKPQFYRKFILEKKSQSVYKEGEKNIPINIYKTISTIKDILLHG